MNEKIIEPNVIEGVFDQLDLPYFLVPDDQGNLHLVLKSVFEDIVFGKAEFPSIHPDMYPVLRTVIREWMETVIAKRVWQ